MKILLSSDNLKLGFDKNRCISSSGRINAMVNDLELFGEVYETSVEAKINCENNKLIANIPEQFFLLNSNLPFGVDTLSLIASIGLT